MVVGAVLDETAGALFTVVELEELDFITGATLEDGLELIAAIVLLEPLL